MIIWEEFDDIVEDIKEMAESFGKVLSVKVPRSNPEEMSESDSSDVKDKKTGKKELDGKGHAFIEYETVELCKKARREITRKVFRGQRIEARYFEEYKYKKGDLSINLEYLRDEKGD